MAEIPMVAKAFKSFDLFKVVCNNRKRSEYDSIAEGIQKLRIKYDFEYWAATCVEIYSKPSPESPESVPMMLTLRLSQRIVLAQCEIMRLAGVPIRVILDKARQWGGTTFCEFYMKWIQNFHTMNWNAAVVAQDDNSAKNIREMYIHAAEVHPKEIATITLKPYAKSTKNLKVIERNAILSVGSIENPKQFRSYSYQMAHLSEVAFWGETAYKNALQLAQSIKASIPKVPLSVIFIESTAHGVGNYFHSEWIAAKAGKSGYVPIFIPWWLIEMYWKKIEDYKDFFDKIQSGFGRSDEKEKIIQYVDFLWEIGASLESIYWYFTYKHSENASWQFMNEEYPSTAEESFISTGRRCFDVGYVNNARKHCTEPALIGEMEADGQKGRPALTNLRFREVANGNLWVWVLPDKDEDVSNRYVTIMDVGGKWKKADYTDIVVLDRYWMMEDGGEEVVAEWHAHLDQDLAAWKAAQIAKFWNSSLLVVERNSLKVRNTEIESEGDHSMTVLDEIAEHYDNLYAREPLDKIREGVPPKWGFFTSVSTKPVVVDALNAALRDDDFDERNKLACDEYDTYEIKVDGTYGARDGSHDDRLMTRAIGLHISRSFMPKPKVIKKSTGVTKRIVNEATI